VIDQARSAKDPAAKLEALRTNNMSVTTYNTALSALSQYIADKDLLTQVDNAVVEEDSWLAKQLGLSLKGQTLFVGGGTNAQRVATAYQITSSGLYGIRESARKVNEAEVRMADYGFDILPGDLDYEIQKLEVEIDDMRRRGVHHSDIDREDSKRNIMDRVYKAMTKDEANPLLLFQGVMEAGLTESELDTFASTLMPYDQESAEDIARRLRGLAFTTTVPAFDSPAGNATAASMSRQNRANSGLTLTGMDITEAARILHSIPWEQLLSSVIRITPLEDTERSLKVEIDLVDPSGNKNTITFNTPNRGEYRFTGTTRLEGRTLLPGIEQHLMDTLEAPSPTQR
jgi:hypothetical protein